MKDTHVSMYVFSPLFACSLQVCMVSLKFSLLLACCLQYWHQITFMVDNLLDNIDHTYKYVTVDSISDKSFIFVFMLLF
jgi:hypothetical protein